MTTLDYARVEQQRFLGELKEFLRIPSVSTQPKHQPDMTRAVNWLCEQLRDVGFPRADVMSTGGHPIVYAEWMAVGPESPTVLIYGHYDVQPPDPVNEWCSPPFQPTLVEDNLFARGASDDKGQLFMHLKALEAFEETVGAPPINVKCIFEGEEEIGSPNLHPFIYEHKDLLAADVVVISDTHILGPDMPSVVYALRGLAYIEVSVSGPERDLHSGIYGGAVHNPVNALCAMIAGLQDKRGRVTVPGFYDKVRDLDAQERAELSKIPFDREAWLREAGVSCDWGDPAYSIIERTSARPTLDVNGIWGGYIQPGSKTVLPSKANAKISMRLVPDQEPEEIAHLVAEYLKETAPPTVNVEVQELHGGDGAIVRRDSPEMQAAFQAYTKAFGIEPVFVREGGSIPVVATFQKALGIETILMGFGLPDDNVHSPNEKFYVPNFYRGIETLIYFFELLGQ